MQNRFGVVAISDFAGAIGARVVVAGRVDAFPIQEISGPARLGFDKPKGRFTRGELQKRSLDLFSC
jgi:hypothetical protein